MPLRADTGEMAAAQNPALADLFAELEQLQRRESEVSTVRRRLHEHLDLFPNEVAEKLERQLSAERRGLHRRIDQLQAQLALAPVRLQLL